MNPSQTPKQQKQKQIEKAIKKRLQNLTGAGVWREVRGQEVTPEESHEAADFWDMIRDYHLPPEHLKDFMPENVSTGHRLVVAEKAPVEDLGKILMDCKDERIIKGAKARCEEENRGDTFLLPEPEEEDRGGSIILP